MRVKDRLAAIGQALKGAALSAEETARVAGRVRDVLQAMNLPLPLPQAMVASTDGMLLFLDDYGLLLRIETHAKRHSLPGHPLVLQPLGDRPLHSHIKIEVCPGVALETTSYLTGELWKALRRGGVDFWDLQSPNVGTIRLPDGNVPIVIDRGAVGLLSETPLAVARSLYALRLTSDPQRKRYADLRKAFKKAWPANAPLPKPAAMRDFLALCRARRNEGVLVSGWMVQKTTARQPDKQSMALASGAAYARQIRARRTQ